MMTKDSSTQFCYLKLPWAREEIIDNLGTRSQKGSPGLVYPRK
jgi:hypothetical protein